MIGVWLGYRIISDELYAKVFGILAKGIGITAFATVSPFGLTSALGLLLAAAVLSPWLVVRQSARFYIEVMRGIPMLVLLFYIAFVAAPALVALISTVFAPWMDTPMRTRDFPLIWRAIAALTLGYAAFHC